MRMNALVGLSLGALTMFAVVPMATATTLDHRFQYSTERFSLHQDRGATIVEMQGATRDFTPGHPDLPWVGEMIEVPAGQRVTQVQVVSIETAPLADRVTLASAIRPQPGLGPIERTDPDPAFFQRAGFQPADPVRIATQGWERGRNMAALQICPVRWDAASGRLERVTSVTVRLTLEAGFGAAVPRLRVVPEWEGPLGPPGPTRLALESAPGSPRRAEPFKATQIPSVLGSPVAYVIITNDAMASEFQRLADWKTQSGVPAVVRTLTFLRQQYLGASDDAERMRLFIRDAYSRWGTKWVLLGGDTDILPTRYGNTSYFGGEDIATDLYFSCVDGNWNADGDDHYGEGFRSASDAGDQCDLMPDVWVGRAPVSSVSAANTFVNKTLTYEKTPPGGYENSLLFFAEILFPQPYHPGDYISLDGATLAEEVLPFVHANPNIRYSRLYQTFDNPTWEPGSVLETRQTVIDSLRLGFNVTVHIGHGYKNVMSVNDGNLDNSDMQALTNGNRLTNFYSTNCTSNAIDFPCIGEAVVQAPNGGAVTNIGSSRLDFPATGRYYEQEYFKLLYRDSVNAVGEALGRSKLPFVSSSNNDGINRWTQMALLLLGDPELRIFTGLPRTLQVTHAATIPLSDTAIVVHVAIGGVPLRNARVTAYKAGDDYRIGTTNNSGDLTLPFRPDNVGSFTLTVTAYDARPYQATVSITAAGAVPVLGDLAPVIDDDNVGGTIGNSNGALNAGETVDLRIPVKNSGGATASSVVGVLSTTDPLVTISVSNVNYGTIAANGTSNPATGFRLVLPFTLNDQREIPLTLTLTDAAARVNKELLQVTVLAPEFLHLSHTVVDNGNTNGRPDSLETVQYSVRLRNMGTGGAATVTGKLRSLDGMVVITDSTSSFGSMASGEEKTGDPFAFTVINPNARLQLRISNEYGELSVQPIDLVYPDPPSDITTTGFTSSIDVRWVKSGSADLRGYNLSRSLASGGPYTKVNAVPNDRTAYYLDSNLPSLTTEWYKVTAVDSSGNESAPTAPASGNTTPGYHAIFPISMGANTPAAVAVEHVYANYPLDIASGAKVPYFWHPDGTSPVDADGSGATSGDFSTLGDRYEAGPSIADLDNDGTKEVIGGIWNPEVYNTANPRVYVFNQSGQLRAGFPVVTYDPLWSSIAIGDLNNDGQKELIFASNGPRLYAYKNNGQEWRDGDGNASTTGIFKLLQDGANYGTPALADLDGNGVLDIVYASYDKHLYAWRPDGTNLPGFPVTIPGFMSASAAIGYLDGASDNELDIVVATGDWQHQGNPPPKTDSLYVFRANGARKAGWPVSVEASYNSRSTSPALGDMNNDGFVDVVFAGADGIMHVLNRNGVPIAPLDGFRYSARTSAASESSPIIADINGDGRNDILMGDEDGKLTAISGLGGLLPGFPIQMPAEVKSVPAVCDCDGDGQTEIVAVSLDGNLFIWDYNFPFSPTLTPPWPQFHHDARRTGFLGSPLYVDAPDPTTVAPRTVELASALPNPAGSRTRIAYAIPTDRAGQRLDLSVFDLSGRQVRELASGTAASGRFSAAWDLRDRGGERVGAGVYFVRLTLGDQHVSQKLIVLY